MAKKVQMVYGGEANWKVAAIGAGVLFLGFVFMASKLMEFGAFLVLAGIVTLIVGLQKRTKPCPNCRTRISRRAETCPQCHAVIVKRVPATA